MKRFFILIPFLLIVSIASADDQCLMIWMTDGSAKAIALSNEPVTTFSDGNMVVKTSKSTITFPLSIIDKYTYEYMPDDVAAPKTEKINFSSDGNAITFKGLKEGTEIKVYSTSGVLVKLQTAMHSPATITLNDLPNGVYAVKVDGITYSIMKR